jgi:hypothetical protein
MNPGRPHSSMQQRQRERRLWYTQGRVLTADMLYRRSQQLTAMMAAQPPVPAGAPGGTAGVPKQHMLVTVLSVHQCCCACRCACCAAVAANDTWLLHQSIGCTQTDMLPLQ